jgi:DNA-directed RNA polymerase specialized sigma24 family protein
MDRGARLAETSSPLLARIKNRDAGAWLQLVKWIAPFLLDWCRDAGLPSSEGYAICGKVLEEVWRGLPAFRKEIPNQSFRRWVYTLTRNRLTLLTMHRSDLHLLPDVETAVGDASATASAWKRQAMQLLLGEFAQQHDDDPGFKACYQILVEGQAVPEVARALGLTPWSVRQQLVIWKERLQTRLREHFGDLLD